MTRNSEAPTGRTVLITGASSGIGCELAKIFAQHGHNLVLVARTQSRLEQLAEDLGTKFGVAVEVIPKDLAIGSAAREIYDTLRQESIKIDILVNNAGFDVHGNFYETSLTKEKQMIQVNLVTLTELTKLLLNDMRQQRYGKILNLGSTGSFVPSPLNAVYSATKAYVLSFSEAIAEELQGSGVTVTVLCPGATRSEFHRRAEMEGVRLLKFAVMDAKHVARAGYRAVMAGSRVRVPGLYNQLQVLFAKLMPRKIVAKTAKIMLQG